MSYIHFHSPSGEAKVSGAERARAQLLCSDMFFAALGVGTFTNGEMYRQLLPSGAYPLRYQEDAAFLQSFRTYCAVTIYEDSHLIIPGTGARINPSDAMFNTAVVGGSDAIRLLAKLHAQCEVHCYVEGEHRAWLAGVIVQGVEDHVLRTFKGYDDAETGWQSVVTLLRVRNDEPVVASFSVTEAFPDFSIARNYGGYTPSEDELKTMLSEQGYNPEDREDEDAIRDAMQDYWYRLPSSSQWAYAMKGLREANKQWKIEVNPHTLATQGYGDGVSGFDIYAALLEQGQEVAQR